MKYKIGDRVVRINSNLVDTTINIGDSGTVITAGDSACNVKWDNSRAWSSSVSNLEHEAIYNSPLNKALE